MNLKHSILITLFFSFFLATHSFAELLSLSERNESLKASPEATQTEEGKPMDAVTYVKADAALSPLAHPTIIPEFVRKNLLLPLSFGQKSIKDFNMEPPPANSSEQTRLELKYLRKLQKAITPEILEDINRVNSKWNSYFRKVVESDSRELMIFESPETQEWLKSIQDDVTRICYEAKYKFNRPRPNQLDSKLKSKLPNEIVPNHPSYPSGHVCLAEAMALSLAELFPAKKSDLNKAVQQIKLGREWALIHFPSDDEAAQKLVRAIYKKISKHEQFKSRLANLKNRIESNQGL